MINYSDASVSNLEHYEYASHVDTLYSVCLHVLWRQDLDEKVAGNVLKVDYGHGLP